MYGLVNARDNQLIFKSCVAISGGPLSKRQLEASELPSHISDKSRRRQIQNPKTRIGGKPLLNEQPNLDRLAEPHFIRDQDTFQRRRVQDVPHQAHLVCKSVHLARVESPLGILGQQEKRPQARNATPCQGSPGVAFWKADQQLTWRRRSFDTLGVDSHVNDGNRRLFTVSPKASWRASQI
jgi:hypothetical protein